MLSDISAASPLSSKYRLWIVVHSKPNLEDHKIYAFYSQVVSNTKVSPGLATDVAFRTNAQLYVECSSLSEDGIEDLVKEIVVTANKCPLPKEERKCVKCCVLIWEQIFRYAHTNVQWIWNVINIFHCF